MSLSETRMSLSETDVGDGGRDPRKQKDFCTNVKKMTIDIKTKNLISVGRRHLFQHYWYKGPVSHIVQYHLGASER